MNDAANDLEVIEQNLVDLLGRDHSALEAIWAVHAERGVGRMLLARAVASLFEVPLLEAKRVVHNVIQQGGVFPHAILPSATNYSAWWKDWYAHDVAVLDRPEQSGPLGSTSPPDSPAFRADLFPSFHDPLRLSVHVTPTPVLRALRVEAFTSTRDPDRVVVSRWPVPIDVETALRHWTAMTYLTSDAVETLRRAAEPLASHDEVHSSTTGLDGISVVGTITHEGRVTRLAGWTLSRTFDPALHRYFDALVQVALNMLGVGAVRSAALDVARYLHGER